MGGRKLPSPIDLDHGLGLYNSLYHVRIAVMTVVKASNFQRSNHYNHFAGEWGSVVYKGR